MAIPYIPPEILPNILLRLPTKTLSKARFVNNIWLQLISSSDFVAAHLERSKKIETLSDHRVIFSATFNGHLLKQFSVEPLLCDSSSIDLVNFGYPENRLRNVWLVGSCNGLVCFASSESQVLVLNPCTGKYNKLPPLDGVGFYISYGFGYDESNDDYKVVVVRLYSLRACDGGNSERSMVHVYSIKSNSWKRINDFEAGVLDFCHGKLVRGKVHWVTDPQFDEGRRRQRRISSFDMRTEVFGVVELPITVYEHIDTTLDVLEGCLCLLLGYKRSHANLWVMKEYGVKDSWTRVVTVSYITFPVQRDYVSPWYVLPNGEILFLTSASSVVYNPKNGSLKFLDVRRSDFRFQPLAYVPSLVSPNGA